MIRTFLLLVSMTTLAARLCAQTPVPGLEGVAAVGDKLAVDESVELVNAVSAPAPSLPGANSTVTRKISRMFSFTSDSVFSVSYSLYRTSNNSADVYQKAAEVSDDQYEGKTFTITRQQTNAIVSSNPQAVLTAEEQKEILSDVGEAFAWVQAATLLPVPQAKISLFMRSDSSVTPAFILGPLIAVKSMSLTHVSDDPSTGSQTFTVDLIVADDCRGSPLAISGQLVLVPKKRIELQVTGNGVVVPSEACAVSPSYQGCPKSVAVDSGCRFSSPGVTTTVKVTRTIAKVP
jgi:hypothetical protein